jgi:hypothetical protein
MVVFLSQEYLDMNINFFRCFVHKIAPISSLRDIMVCETLPSGGLIISPLGAYIAKQVGRTIGGLRCRRLIYHRNLPFYCNNLKNLNKLPYYFHFHTCVLQ